jgi:hypothetical protein
MVVAAARRAILAITVRASWPAQTQCWKTLTVRAEALYLTQQHPSRSTIAILKQERQGIELIVARWHRTQI